MHSKRSESVVTAQHDIHERSSIEAAARATQHQRNGISPTAPWRFVRDPAKLLLRSLCSRCALYALVAINALQIYEQTNHDGLGALAAFPLRLSYALGDRTTLMTIVTALLPIRV